MGNERPLLAMEEEKLAMEGEQDEGKGFLVFGCASEGLGVRVWRVGGGSEERGRVCYVVADEFLVGTAGVLELRIGKG